MKEDHQYMNDEYKTLLTTLKDIDKNYSHTKNLEQRVVFARNAISVWNDFVTREGEQLSKDEFHIRDDTMIKLRELWDRFKQRNKQTIPSEDVIKFHHEFTKFYNFSVPLHVKSIAMLLHPHWGYFCKFTKKEFAFDDIIKHYHNEFLSSHYRNIGRVC
jgi:hypothetical protein